MQARLAGVMEGARTTVRTAAGRWLELRSAPVDGGNNLLLYTDVTDAEETRGELSDRNRQLDRLNADLELLRGVLAAAAAGEPFDAAVARVVALVCGWARWPVGRAWRVADGDPPRCLPLPAVARGARRKVRAATGRCWRTSPRRTATAWPRAPRARAASCGSRTSRGIRPSRAAAVRRCPASAAPAPSRSGRARRWLPSSSSWRRINSSRRGGHSPARERGADTGSQLFRGPLAVDNQIGVAPRRLHVAPVQRLDTAAPALPHLRGGPQRSRASRARRRRRQMSTSQATYTPVSSRDRTASQYSASRPSTITVPAGASSTVSGRRACVL